MNTNQTERPEYTHCTACDGTGLDRKDNYTPCIFCIGQGGLYIEPKPIPTLQSCYCDLIHMTCSHCKSK
jgi:hypothetical protein